MKKGFKIALISVLILLGTLMVSLALISSGKFFNGYYLGYEVNEDNETCTVTKCILFGASEMVVPDRLGRYRVTEIDSYAFANCQGMTSLSLPNSLTNIGIGAFYECNRLTDVTIPDSVTHIDSYAFYGCSALTGIALSERIENIGTRVFEGCTALTTATVPATAIHALPADNISSVTVNGGTSIGEDAFLNLKSLTDITIAPSVEVVDKKAFRGCENITTATIPASAASAIPKSSLTHVVINGGTHIAERAFEYCNYLLSVTLPPSLTSIGNAAFIGCYKLAEIYNLSSIAIAKGSHDNGCIGQYALSIHTSTSEMPKTWIDEEGYLFYEDGDLCYLLGFTGAPTELSLPEDCNGKSYIIREYAFYMDSGITAITFPEGVTAIEANAFAHCRGLTEISFPKSLVSVGERAFFECDELKEISFEKGITTIGRFAFDESYKIERVLFNGTTAEWQQVETGTYWIDRETVTEVICTDGVVALH